MSNEIIRDWLDIAKSDLESVKLLYDNEHYRTSYFWFQQASEKVAKAIATFNGFSPEKVRQISHRQFKPLSSNLTKRLIEIEESRQIVEIYPKVDPKNINEEYSLENAKKRVKEGLSFIDSLNHIDLVLLDESNLKELIDLLEEHQSYRLEPDGSYNEAMEKSKKITLNYLSNFPNFQKEDLERLNAYFSSEEFHKFILRYITWIVELCYIYEVSFNCSLVTQQHSTKTRYNEENHKCLEVYVESLPIVKFQPQFVSQLKSAILRFEDMLESLDGNSAESSKP
jgi:HEPN domain-containing protein